MERARWNLIVAVGIIAFCFRGHNVNAQQPVDSSVQASPVKAPAPVPVVDDSAEASPVPAGPKAAGGARIAAGAGIQLKTTQAASSATLKNGDTIQAVLAAPVRLSGGGSLPAGASVKLTVVETSPAGKIDSAGDFTLQVVRVGTVAVVTEIQEFKGKAGHKDLPDSAPTKGTEALLAAGSALTFHVQAEPKM